jgi:hypothetical protein
MFLLDFLGPMFDLHRRFLVMVLFLLQSPLRTIFLSHVGGMIISSSSEEVLILPRAEHDEHYRASTLPLKVIRTQTRTHFVENNA